MRNYFEAFSAKEESVWLKKIYGFTGFIAAIAGVYFAWLSIHLLTSDNTQQNLLVVQGNSLGELKNQNEKLDTTLIQLKSQNEKLAGELVELKEQSKILGSQLLESKSQSEKLSNQLSLTDSRYTFDSLTIDRGTKRDYLHLKYSLIEANGIVGEVCDVLVNSKSIASKYLIDSMRTAVAVLKSQEENNIFLDNEKMRLKWINYESDILNYIDVDLKYNSHKDSTGNFQIINQGNFLKNTNELKRKSDNYDINVFGPYIARRVSAVKSLQMPTKKRKFK